MLLLLSLSLRLLFPSLLHTLCVYMLLLLSVHHRHALLLLHLLYLLRIHGLLCLLRVRLLALLRRALLWLALVTLLRVLLASMYIRCRWTSRKKLPLACGR